MGKKNIFLVLLVIGTAFWGISFSVTKLSISNHSPQLFLLYRFVGATLVLSIVFRKKLKHLNYKSIVSGALLAIPLMLGIGLQTLGIKLTSASQSAFLAGTCVVIVPMLKMAMYRKVPNLKIWIAASLSLVGLFIISVKNGFSVNAGDMFTIGGAIAFAYYLIRVEEESARIDIVATIVPMFATCALLTFVAVAWSTSESLLPADNTFWFGVIFCSLFSTAYMYSVSNMAQQYISAERVSVIYLLEPIFGALAAAYLIGEVITWQLLIGGLFIFAGMGISELKLKVFRNMFRTAGKTLTTHLNKN
ncbi:DMT family transporter [Pedobacter sp. HDW13]|uniref:DMT family transporter n=1 Tax=unclassified Pedobacter TaxID=2628915 RepID=UPI000F5B532E|nr:MULTISPECIES: DMT family transporter [unclassified Pedobacter]QIL42336.1 DMT family transporter [Pedobacter sp. HDW13]RQO76422.1 EamA/RhaT family transporter [Pedobacter sp. KBW01]